ncbi:hypothetical protein ACFY2W_16340 [Streptomyces sp. NPDC001262]|uniref:hypothetical protein n=1 Tax=Streptomyces TaxID=1883 RepID=UPI00300FCDB2
MRHQNRFTRPARQRYGNRWVYARRNPKGLALVILIPLAAVAALLLISSGAPR